MAHEISKFLLKWIEGIWLPSNAWTFLPSGTCSTLPWTHPQWLQQVTERMNAPQGHA